MEKTGKDLNLWRRVDNMQILVLQRNFSSDHILTSDNKNKIFIPYKKFIEYGS